jgi:hypothetical protein
MSTPNLDTKRVPVIGEWGGGWGGANHWKTWDWSEELEWGWNVKNFLIEIINYEMTESAILAELAVGGAAKGRGNEVNPSRGVTLV